MKMANNECCCFFAGVVIYFLYSAMKTKNVNSKKKKQILNVWSEIRFKNLKSVFYTELATC